MQLLAGFCFNFGVLSLPAAQSGTEGEEEWDKKASCHRDDKGS
jgi:hypothetical protein